MFSPQTVNMVYKRVCRDCPIPGCGAKYLVILANHLADVHQLDYTQHSEDSVNKRPNFSLKLQSSFMREERINQEKNHYAITCILRIRRRRRQRERQKSNTFNNQNNNFARASRFFVHFFVATARLRLISRCTEKVHKRRRNFLSLSWIWFLGINL